MTSINFAKLLADERKKARLAQANGEPKKGDIPVLSLSRVIKADDETELAKYKVGSIPNVYYIPHFVTQEESDLILKHVYSHQNKWTKLKRRRLQNWGGIPSSRGMLPEALPPFLHTVCTHMAQCHVFAQPPNHILLNEYTPGQGIMSHKDGPLYFPRVAILSLSGPAVIEFRKEISQPPSMSLYLHPRSLLIFQDDAYTEYFHGIQEVERDEITSVLANLKISSPSSSPSSPSPSEHTTTTTTTSTSTLTPQQPEKKREKRRRRRECGDGEDSRSGNKSVADDKDSAEGAERGQLAGQPG